MVNLVLCLKFSKEHTVNTGITTFLFSINADNTFETQNNTPRSLGLLEYILKVLANNAQGAYPQGHYWLKPERCILIITMNRGVYSEFQKY